MSEQPHEVPSDLMPEVNQEPVADHLDEIEARPGDGVPSA